MGDTEPLRTGFAYLPKATETFLAQACEQGAKVLYNSEVQSLQRGPSDHVASMPFISKCCVASRTIPQEYVLTAPAACVPAGCCSNRSRLHQPKLAQGALQHCLRSADAPLAALRCVVDPEPWQPS